MKTEELLEKHPYDGSHETDDLFMAALREELIYHYEHNAMYRRFCDRKGFDPHHPFAIEEIPPVSVSVFKELGFQLSSVPKKDLTLTLQSSATSGVPSTVVLDKMTAKRQGKAMIKVVGEFIGKGRKPFLIMDIDPLSTSRKLLGARFAAVTGYLKFASKVGYFLHADDQGVFYFDVNGMRTFVETLPPEQPVVVFGFTYILYQNVLMSVLKSGEKIRLPQGSKIIHIGGWKKLESQKINKNLFNEQLASCFGINPADVIDIYGFTEQMGLNYPDCPCGYKHVSSYARVLVRDTVTREPLPAGKEGLLEFVTPVPHSYPGNAVLTDDIGVLDDSPCPYGRSGQRFRVIGRLKKAEVRGCGDILSSKLAFHAPKVENIVEDRNLEIQYFKGEVEDHDSRQKLQSLIDRLNAQSEWLRRQPVESLIGIIAKIAKVWLSDPKFQMLNDKGLLFLSQWCDESHLSKIAKEGLRGNILYADKFLPFADSDKHFLKANPRGLVCHWMAGNVQILGMFALVQCIITKNQSLVKVAAKDGGVFALLLSAFEGIEYTTAAGHTIKGDDLVKTVAVVYFSRQAIELGETMSMAAKVRIAWGGKEAVETVAGYPSSIDCETVVFGPKLSYAVIAREALSSEQEAKKLARKVSVDVSVFDQAGCASPHNLYIEKGGEVSPERFCEILAESFPKTETQIPKPPVSPEQVSAVHSVRGVYDFKGKVWGSDTMSWTILYSEENELCKPVYSRTLMVHPVEHINDALQHVKEYVQTIGIAAPMEKAVAFADKATATGVARCPQIGRMLNFEMPWDGIFLVDHLVKWNTLGGPLR